MSDCPHTGSVSEVDETHGADGKTHTAMQCDDCGHVFGSRYDEVHECSLGGMMAGQMVGDVVYCGHGVAIGTTEEGIKIRQK